MVDTPKEPAEAKPCNTLKINNSLILEGETSGGLRIERVSFEKPTGTVNAINCSITVSEGYGGAAFRAPISQGNVDDGFNTGWDFSEVLVTVATGDVTNLAPTSLVGNASISNSLEAGIFRRGFCLFEGSEGDPTTEDTVIDETGSFGDGAFSLLIDSLNSHTEYRIRSFAECSVGIVYGESISVTTLVDSPDDLAAVGGSQLMALTWTEKDGADYYFIYYSTTKGVTTTDKFVVGFGNSYIQTNLLIGTRYYYRIASVVGGVVGILSLETSGVTENPYPDFRPQNWLDIEDYVKLLTSQYQLAENFKSWLRHNLEFYTGIMEAANQMNNDFDLDFAVGDQLDIIGDIVGQSRMLPFDPSDGSDPNLDDETYRTLLKAKIALNHWDGTLFSIEQKWVNIFPDTRILIVDNQDMTMNVSVLGNISELIQDLIEHDMIIPRPQGVMINYAWSPRSVIYFAYDIDNNEYSGYDKGRWSAIFTEG